MNIDINELFKGVAVVIDDEVNDPNANIQKILYQISSLNIPVITYEGIPSREVVSHFQGLSFVLFDWKLIKPEENVPIPAGLEEEYISQNIKFLKHLKEVCYCPIFIFSNEYEGVISDKLILEDLFTPDKPNNIFIRLKSSLMEESSLQKAIEDWIKNNPSIYVLKEWEREYQKSKNRLFLEFQQLSPVWPQVMWKCFSEDGGNKSLELGELISLNLHTRMKPFEFNDDILKSSDAQSNRDELRKVLEGAKFLKDLHEDDISTGDVFREEYQDETGAKHRYWLNIRAQCDTIRNSKVGEIEIYCLKGRIIDEACIYFEEATMPKDKKGYHINEGQFVEQINNAIIPFIDNGKIIEFLFCNIAVKKWKDFKTKRIGRLLPPYITRIQQRFALYLHRQGLPRIPKEAIF